MARVRALAKRRSYLALFAAVGLTAACSSISRPDQTTAIAGEGAVVGATSTTAAAGGGDGGAADGSNGDSQAGGGGAGGAGGAAGGGAGGGAAGTTCQKALKLGVSYSTDISAGFGAVGQPDRAAEYAQYTEVVQRAFRHAADDVNKRGGVNGCPVQLVFHDFAALAADGFDGQSQRECSHWTQDDPVFAGIPLTLETRVLIDCMAKRGAVTFFQTPRYTPSARDYRQYGQFLYQTNGMVTDRWKPFIDHLRTAGYFGKGAKVGLLVGRDGSGNNERLANNIWLPRLRQLGYDDVEVFHYNQISSFATVGDASSQMQTAALQFKTAGVTHLLFMPDGGDAVIFFGAAAENADFAPRWALSTQNAVSAFESVPERQREGAMAVSYSFLDLGLEPDPRELADNPPNAARQRCANMMRGYTGGQPPLYFFCDILEFLRASLDGAPAITAQALQAGAHRLGDRFQIASGYDRSFFGPGRHDGAQLVRVLEWTESRGWTYATGRLAVP